MARDLAILLIALALLASCGDLGGLGGLDVLGADTGIAPVDPVFSCSFQSAGYALELCYDQDAVTLAASVMGACGDTVTCGPSARVPGCLYHCNGGRGCNALEGCWCPDLHVKCTPNAP